MFSLLTLLARQRAIATELVEPINQVLSQKVEMGVAVPEWTKGQIGCLDQHATLSDLQGFIELSTDVVRIVLCSMPFKQGEHITECSEVCFPTVVEMESSVVVCLHTVSDNRFAPDVPLLIGL